MDIQPPSLDKRRRSHLYQELLEIARAMIPSWKISKEHGDDDYLNALFKIVAQLQENTSVGIDETPLRDKLAFFDFLDLPIEWPRPAKTPVVFQLSDKRTNAVFAPRATQVSANTDDGEILFETLQGIDLTPSALTFIAAVDGDQDSIELPPPGFLALAPQSTLLPQFQAASFSSSGSNILQIKPLGDIEAGDVIRVNGTAYEVELRNESVFQLHPALENDVVAETDGVIEKITSFDTFTLRNKQKHYLYIGHNELFKLEQVATLFVEIKPANVIEQLRSASVRWSMYAKLANEDQASWVELELGASESDKLVLEKKWVGAVEKIAINNNENLWLRAEYVSPITENKTAGTRVNRLSISVKTGEETETALLNVSKNSACACSDQNLVTANSAGQTAGDAEGSATVTQAFHNGTSLPLTTRFLPFGPEPQRFDTFALAIPEVLSKKNAKATLSVTLPDATLLHMGTVQKVSGTERVYGVSSNGSLQGMLFKDAVDDLVWQEIGQPSMEDVKAGDEGATLNGLNLDTRVAPRAIQTIYAGGVEDQIIVRDRRGAWWVAQVDVKSSGDTAFENSRWTQLSEPAAGDMAADYICLAHENAGYAPFFYGSILSIIDGALKRLYVGLGLLTSSNDYFDLPATDPLNSPVLGTNTQLLIVQTQQWPKPKNDFPLEFLVLDENATFWLGSIDLFVSSVNWQMQTVNNLPNIALDINACAMRDENNMLIIFAASDQNAALTIIPSIDVFFSVANFTVQTGSELKCQPKALYQQPVALAWGRDDSGDPAVALMTTAGKLAVLPLPLPRPEAGVVDSGHIFVSQGLANLCVNLADEGIARKVIGSSSAFSPHHGLRTPAGFNTEFIEFVASADFKLHLFQPLNQFNYSGDELYALNQNLPAVAGNWLFWSRSAGQPNNLQGVSQNNGLEIQLPQNHFIPAANGMIKIAMERYTAAVSSPAPNVFIATLDRSTNITDGDPVQYEVLEPSNIPQINVGNEYLNTLGNLGANSEQPEQGTLVFFDSANVADQVKAIVQSYSDNGDIWVLLDSGWADPMNPPTPPAMLTVQNDLSVWSTFSFPRGFQNPELAWEYYDGSSWRRLEQGFLDTTNQLANTGEIRFIVPNDIEPVEIGGEEDFWIRSRLIGGDYGQAEYVVTEEPGPNPQTTTQKINVNTDKLNPPEILKVDASFEMENSVPAETVLIQNNLGFSNQTQASLVNQAEFELFEGVRQINQAGQQRLLYFGFTQNFSVGQLTLFIDAADQLRNVPLAFELLTEQGWRRVSSADETQGFHRRGYIQVSIEFSPRLTRLFDRDLYWLRARPRVSVDSWAPQLSGVFVNAVPAEQVQSRKQEILGSSTGEKLQVFPISQKPVLPQNFELRVREDLSAEEREALLENDRMSVVQYTDLSIEGDWVKWQAVDSFVGFNDDARVFRLNSRLGEIIFGENTKIPPPGRNNIRLINYQVGGGTTGNLAAYKIENIKSNIPGVELVANPIAAAGGTEPPSIEVQATTTPEKIRHSNNALGPDDFEALAIASSPKIVAARCQFPQQNDLAIRIAIAAEGEDECPLPSLEERQALENLIRERAWGGLQDQQIEVVGPDYVSVKIDLEIKAKSLELSAVLEREAREKLARLLHPIYGGPKLVGWPFLRRIWPSDILRCLATIPSFDRVVSDIAIATIDPCQSLDAMPDFGLICAGKNNINVRMNLDFGGMQ